MFYDKSNEKENSKIDINEVAYDERLDRIKFWKNRIKFDSAFLYTWFIIYFFQAVVNNYFYYIIFKEINFPFFDILVLSTMIFALYIEKLIKGSFEDLIVSNKEIFQSKESFQRYLNYMYNKFDSKLEKYLPIIFILIYVAILFLFMDLWGNLLFGGHLWGDFMIPTDFYFLNIIKIILEVGFVWSTWFLVVGSGLIIIITTFLCINQLGSETFPLNVTYEELKIGAFEKIGKFVISLSIPSILISTVFSILGLINIYLFEEFFVGYIYLFIGLFITIIFAYLLYKNTINLHEAIKRFKFNLKYDLIKEIQNLTTEKEENYNLNRSQKFQTIRNIHHYYDRIDEINDWPFNPKSFRKLTITFLSSILPLILSFFGLI